MHVVRMIVFVILCSFAGYSSADECSDIVFEGQGAGQVVFNLQAHTAKGLTCASCHEGKGFSFALFEMKRGGDNITMRVMERGSSCGYCHDGKKAFSVTASLDCDKCHHK